MQPGREGLPRSAWFALYVAIGLTGISVGALLCVKRYARLMALGFALALVCCLGVSSFRWPQCLAAFLFLGIGVGLSMSAVNLYVGRELSRGVAPALALLNFAWGVGALLAAVFAARILLQHSYRAAYALLGLVSGCAALLCWTLLRDGAEPTAGPDQIPTGASNQRRIAALALAAFLEVGVENLSLAWLSTFASRMAGRDAAWGAALSAVYWFGFLGSRALASLVLVRVLPSHLLRVLLPAALCAALLLVASFSLWAGCAALALLGIALGPVYPLIIARSFTDLNRTADTRWILGAAGFGGSILPWLTGWISAHFGGIRAGLLTLPAALLLMLFLVPMDLRKRTTTTIAG
jgi:MFS transporter, FHS family, glucose/mannose:H+ symporter